MAAIFAKLSRLGKYILLFIMGLLSVFALAPFHIWPLYGVAIIFLILALDDAKNNEKPLKAGFWRAFCFGFAYIAFGMFWVAQAFLVDAAKFAWLIPFAMSALPAGMGLFYGFAGLLYVKFAPNNARRTFWFAFCFALFEYLRGTLFTGLPWNLTAYIFKAGGAISQNGALFGPYGVTLLALLFFASFATINEKYGIIQIILISIIAAFGFAFGYYRLGQPVTYAQNAPNIAVGQAGFSQKDLWDIANREQVINSYLGQLQNENAKKSQIIIWPEGAFPFELFNDEETLTRLNPMIKDKLLIVGAPHAEYQNGEEKYYNSAAFLTQGDEKYPKLLDIYNKHHLVPFGEYLPFRPLFNAIGISSLVAYGTDFSKGEAPRIIKIGNLPAIDARICYEIIFPHFNKSQIRPDLIVNVSVDAWYGDFLGPDQHYNQARWRAIEEGLPLVRAASGGWSGIIDSYGRPISDFRKGNSIISHKMPNKLKYTPYLRFGNAIFFLLMVVIAVFAFANVRKLSLKS